MGLFDFLFGGSVEQQIQKHAKRIKSKDTPIEDRQASAHWLAENASPAAIRGLIGRFEMDYEHGMKDTAEKEEVRPPSIPCAPACSRPRSSPGPSRSTPSSPAKRTRCASRWR